MAKTRSKCSQPSSLEGPLGAVSLAPPSGFFLQLLGVRTGWILGPCARTSAVSPCPLSAENSMRPHLETDPVIQQKRMFCRVFLVRRKHS